ncbi:hypothetical protein ACTNDG_12615, partial [Clostridium sp. HCP1S3_B4]
MYDRLCEGKIINKSIEAHNFGVDERSIQRYIDDIRAYLENKKSLHNGDSRTKNKDKIEVANKYITAGYCISLVLKIVKLGRSTYYYNINYKVKDEDKVKPAGRKPIGYSLTKNNKKVCDDEIKDYIIEGINGDAQYYGYRKITHYLRRTYN